MKVGICGLGMMGQAHLANLSKIDGVTVAALCDSDEERLSLAKAVTGNIRFEHARDSLDRAPRFTNFARMLGEDPYTFTDRIKEVLVTRNYDALAAIVKKSREHLSR